MQYLDVKAFAYPISFVVFLKWVVSHNGEEKKKRFRGFIGR